MAEITFVPDENSELEIVSEEPLVVRLSEKPASEEVQIIRNPEFHGQGDWRRNEIPIVYEWEFAEPTVDPDLYPKWIGATTGNGSGRPAMDTDPQRSLRFKARQHDPILPQDGPIPYGKEAWVYQTTTLDKQYSQGRLSYRQVAHFDVWDESKFYIKVLGRKDASERWQGIFQSDKFEYVPSPDQKIQLWQTFEHSFKIPDGVREFQVWVGSKMPSRGRTGTKVSEFYVYLS